MLFWKFWSFWNSIRPHRFSDDPIFRGQGQNRAQESDQSSPKRKKDQNVHGSHCFNLHLWIPVCALISETNDWEMKNSGSYLDKDLCDSRDQRASASQLPIEPIWGEGAVKLWQADQNGFGTFLVDYLFVYFVVIFYSLNFFCHVFYLFIYFVLAATRHWHRLPPLGDRRYFSAIIFTVTPGKQTRSQKMFCHFVVVITMFTSQLLCTNRAL